MASAASSLRAAGGNERFNKEAAAWDANPFVHEMSQAAFQALREHIPAMASEASSKKLDVLEIGCGTGLLTMPVAGVVRQVVAVDAAQGMIDVLQRKVKQAGVENVIPLAVLLEDPEDTSLPPSNDNEGRLKFDLVTSHLVLHHIPQLQPVLRTILGCLKPGGQCALTDFEDFGPEAKRFHPESKMGGVERHGINAQWMTKVMQEIGFVDVDVKVAWEHEKRVERWPGEFIAGQPIGADQGERMKFTYLICKGTKPR